MRFVIGTATLLLLSAAAPRSVWDSGRRIAGRVGLGLLSAAAPRSVWDRVYSKDQAGRGLKLYNAQCARCHGEALLGGEGSPPLVDKDFLEKWYGRPVGHLVELTRETMPSDGPGKVSRKQCTGITAYLLSVNGFPAGETELEPDPDILNEILIQANK